MSQAASIMFCAARPTSKPHRRLPSVSAARATANGADITMGGTYTAGASRERAAAEEAVKKRQG